MTMNEIEENGRDLTAEELKAEIEEIFRSIAEDVRRERDLSILEDVLFTEIRHWNNLLKTDDSQFNRRALIRSIMAFIEGSTYALRETILHGDKASNLDLSEKTFLSDKKFSLQKDGTIKIEKSGFHSTLPMLLLTLRSYIKANNLSVSVDIGSRSWQDMKTTYDLRNDISHPKRPDLIHISDKALETAKRAFNWYADICSRMHSSVLQNVRENYDPTNSDLVDELEKIVSKINSTINWFPL